MSEVGVRLRKLRTQRGLTQTEVSGGRYSKEYVSQVELGKTQPSRKAIKLFAEHLDVDESYFETGVVPAGRERFENLMAKGELQLERSEPGDAAQTFAEAGSIAQDAENQELFRRAEAGRAWALHLSGDHHGASVVLNDARLYYEDHPPEGPELAVVLYRLARVRQALGDLGIALLLLESATIVLRRVGTPDGRLRLQILRALAEILRMHGDLEAGRQAAEEALGLARILGDRRALAETYWGAALLEEQRHDYVRATEYALRAREVLADLGERRDRARLLGELGEITSRMGRPRQAVGYFQEALELLGEDDGTPAAAGVLYGLAAAWLSLGDTQASLGCAARSLTLLAEQEDLGGAAGPGHLLRARAFLTEGLLRECRDELETAKRYCERGEPRRFLSGCMLLEGDLFLAEGRLEQAAAAFRRSSEVAQDARG